MAWLHTGTFVSPLGAIKVYISDDGLTLANLSRPTHIFHEGQVVRTYDQDADGNWYVTTYGAGTNDGPLFPNAIDSFNTAVGPAIFDAVDAQMLEYIIVDQSAGYSP